MSRMLPRATSIATLAFLLLAPSVARSQTFEVLGTRAAGMGGAFVAVADDATAVYWNPAGLALGGTYFNLVIDTGQGNTEPDGAGPAGRTSGSIVAITALPLGLSYYRLSNRTVRPVAGALATPAFNVSRLTTHNVGVTLVHSLTSHVAVATTARMVRGVAEAALVFGGDRDDLLDDGGALHEGSSTKFDVDVGVMAAFGTWRAGLTARNLTEPEFEADRDQRIEVARQTRAGITYVGVPLLIVAADIDLERNAGPLGDVRNFAAGAEARIFPRAFVRSGFRFNTLSDQPGGRAPVYSLGGGVVAYRSITVDAQATLGSESGNRGWSVSARFGY